MKDIINGKYALETWLGGGSFSDVWKANDIQVPGVVKAIKIYKPTEQTENLGREIMMGEYGIMANTNHPNLLRPDYFDYCHGGKYDGRPYLVLTYCGRGNIKNLMGKFTEADAWHLIHDMASALAYLHNQKPPILHQDIKPENILIGDNGEYLLTDFGVSVKVKPHQDFSDNSVVERAKLSAGTLTYMAPERFQKNQKPILANDVWALGATIYEMLTGFPPFELGGSNQRRGDEIVPIEGDFSKKLCSVIHDTLCQDTAKRPRAEMLEGIANEALHRIANELPVDDEEEQPVGEPKQESKAEEIKAEENVTPSIHAEENHVQEEEQYDSITNIEEPQPLDDNSPSPATGAQIVDEQVERTFTQQEKTTGEDADNVVSKKWKSPFVDTHKEALVGQGLPSGNSIFSSEAGTESLPNEFSNEKENTLARESKSPSWVYFAAVLAGLSVGILISFII